MKRKSFIIVIIIFLLMMTDMVFADGYKNSFSDMYGNKVYFTKVESGNSCTIILEGSGISVTKDSCITALTEARLKYESDKSYVRASNEDDIMTKLGLEGISPDDVGNEWVFKFLTDYFPGLLKKAIGVQRAIFGIIFAFCIFATVLSFVSAGFLPSHPIQRRAQIVAIFTSLILGGITVFLLVNTLFIEYMITSFVLSLVFSANIEVLANKGISTINSISTGMMGIGVLTFILAFIIVIIKLGASAGNPQKRAQVQSEIITKGLFLTGFGGVSILIGFAINLFNFKIM